MAIETHRNISPNDQWLDKLAKLLPAEATGAYLFARSLANPSQIDDNLNMLIVFVIIFILLPFFNNFVLGINKIQNAVITVSFFIWVVNIDTFRLTHGIYEPYVSDQQIHFWAPMLMVLWVLMIVPFVSGRRVWRGENHGAS